MKYFETRYGAGAGMEQVRIRPEKEALYAAAFGLDTLDILFDQDTPSTAIPVLDAAIYRFNHEPNTLRHLVPADEKGGMFRTRQVLEQMRATLADFPDASITGPVED